MKIQDITAETSPDAVVKAITNRKPENYEKTLKTLKQDWEVETHRTVIDQEFLPDKPLKNAKGETIGLKKVNRIAVPFQKMIVNRAVAFGFANDVKLEHNAGDDKELATIIEAIERVLYENKQTSFNRKIARDLYRGKEVAEIWYFQKGATDHENYGFKTSYHIRCMLISPWNNNTLHPVFNEYGNLIAFGREYTINRNGKDVVYVDVYTDEEIKRFVKADGSWSEEPITADGKPTTPITKIPIVYASQDRAEWEDVRFDIERLELLFSKHCEINDYHAAPKTFVKGEIKSLPVAGESNPVLKGGIDTDVQILSWKDSPESIKLEIETRLENIFKFTQTADISFKSVKGLSQISGVMLKMLFMDVHLKIMDKNEIWDEYFTRRYSVIKTMLTILNPKWQKIESKLEISPIIKPFMIDDLKATVETLMTANGNQAIISRKKSLELSGLVSDIDSELEQIILEEKQFTLDEMTEPQNLTDIPDEI